MTHVDNIPHILEFGITHRNSQKANPNYKSIGDFSLIGSRNTKIVNVSNGLDNNHENENVLIGDFIPFYFGLRTPMLYVIQKGGNFVPQKTAPDDIIYCVSSVQKIIDSELFDVNILTHCNSIKEGADKVRYIRKHFKDMTVIICPKEISKTKMVHTEGAILVDDYAGNLREWEKEGGIPVRFSTKLNGKGYLVIDKLDELINMFGSVVCK